MRCTQPDAIETDRVDRGFRIERVVRDLTDPKRKGDVDTPFKLGDQILVTYRVNNRKLQNYVARITVALEDQRFYEHTGIDWRATVGACIRNFRSGHVVSGGSTITQQLVKHARNLTLAEAVFLAGIPQAPTRLNPWRYPDLTQRKFARSVERLVRLSLITRAQRTLLSRFPAVARRFDPPRLAQHFVDAVRVLHPIWRRSTAAS